MRNYLWVILVNLILVLSQSSIVWSWTSNFSRQSLARDYVRNVSRGAYTIMRHRGNTATTTRTTTTRLSVFGWFQSEDEGKSVDKEESDSDVSEKLSGVAGIMNSMKSFTTSKRVSLRSNAILQDLSNVMVEGSSADGKVKVTYNGQQQPVRVQIDETYFQSLGRKSGAAELSIALTEAMQEAHTKSASKMEEKVKSLYSDLGFDTA